MVEFEEIKDEHYEENDGFEDEEDGSDGDYSDASDDDQGQDEDVQDETPFLVEGRRCRYPSAG